jgi:hypothetical protein
MVLFGSVGFGWLYLRIRNGSVWFGGMGFHVSFLSGFAPQDIVAYKPKIKKKKILRPAVNKKDGWPY